MIKEEIQKAMILALKSKKETELKVLRFVLSQINYEEINKQKKLTDEEVISVLQKEVKKRKEAIEMFKKGKREDLVIDEEKQIDKIKQYLPKELDQKELEIGIAEVISSSADTSNVGKIIGLVMARLRGRADGANVAQLVKQKLNIP